MSIYVCFSLKSIVSTVNSNEEFEKDYQSIYKYLAKFLYTHQNFCFTFSFSGNQLLYLEKKRFECIKIFQQLTTRGQVEILGGGFYDPIFPLIYPIDRNGQIDKMSACLRQTIGKRPRGISIFEDCWDSSLIGNFTSCGIEYVLLEKSLIPENKLKFLPIVSSELGKSIDIIPYYPEFVPSQKDSPESFINKIVEEVSFVEKKDKYIQYEPDRLVTINLSHKEIISLIESKWFEKLDEYLQKDEEKKIILSTPSLFRKNKPYKIPAHISSGINKNVIRYIDSISGKNVNKNYTIHSFMDFLPQGYKLYCRILYLSMLINQIKKDKMRKRDAKEKLWAAQNGNCIISNETSIGFTSFYRQNAYKNLMDAEKIIRESCDFTESVYSFDYNNDGFNEYICRMNNYFACISLDSGSIQELEILRNTGNYADNYSRKSTFDLCTDGYNRGIFVDHLFTNSQFENYKNNLATGTGIFSQIKYNETKFSSKHNTISLNADALCGKNKQKISLKKKYIINSTGMSVQYILKNESEQKFSGTFVVESNFSHLNFIPNSTFSYNLEVLDNENKIEVETSSSNNNLFENISFARLSDIENGVAFSFEPNENSGFWNSSITFNRPDYNCDIAQVGKTTISSLFWEIEIEPGMETERTINFTISSVKKQKKKS